MKTARHSGRPRNLGRTVMGGLLALFLLLLAGGAWVWFAPCWLGGCVPVNDLARFQAEGSELLDVHGEPFGTLATVNRRIVSLDSLPPHLPQAFIAVEDRRFYQHWGLDLQRMFGAGLANVRAGGVAEGGSTITMQLARNLFPDMLPYQERSLRRKVMEIRVARQLERTFPKDKILELYLNHIYLGAGAYGVEAASQTYFGKSAAEVDLAEAALLGGLPKAPSVLDPTRNPDRALDRRNLVLREMAEVGYISPQEAEAAREESLQLASRRSADDGLESSYFIERVRRELEETVGDRFYTAGLRIHTTLDPVAQRAAEEELAAQLDRIESGQHGLYRHPRYAESRGVAAETGATPYLQGMVVVMDARTGAVRALVGGRNFDDSKFDRAAQALRQPGSAFKPFIYLAALERYRSPVHIVDDSPLRLTLARGRYWEPQNYTGDFSGPITLREALTRSKNVATVRLAQEVGMGTVIRTARQLGITTDIPDFPSTALGAAEVRPLELVAAYAPFANGGNTVEPHFVQRIEDRHGRIVWEAAPERRRVLDPATAFVLTSMMQDVVDRGTGTEVRGAGFGGPAAGKTGTTNEMTDVWFVGYTPELVGGVWIGLDQPQTIMRQASGGRLAAPVWGRMMRRVYSDRPMPSAWEPPARVVTAQVERGTGIVVGEDCPAQGPTYSEYFIGVAPPRVCPRERPYYVADAGQSWLDEEWSSESFMSDTLTASGAEESIRWPELEEMRRERAEREALTAAADTAERRAGEPPTGREIPARRDTTARDTTPRDTVPRDTAPARERPTPRDTVAPRDTARPPPELLGRPVRPDTVRPR